MYRCHAVRRSSRRASGSSRLDMPYLLFTWYDEREPPEDTWLLIALFLRDVEIGREIALWILERSSGKSNRAAPTQRPARAVLRYFASSPPCERILVPVRVRDSGR